MVNTEEHSRQPDTVSREPDFQNLLLLRVAEFADEVAHSPNLGLQTAPRRDLERLGKIGLTVAPLPVEEGGLGLGTEPGTQKTLLRLLTSVGGADLALGRIYEGHVNALLLVQRYGTKAQVSRMAQDVHAGMISGVWNTGLPELLKLLPVGPDYKFAGEKTFATGAAFVQRPIVTAEIPGRGWQMTMPHMETLGVSIDRSFWHPFGMESSESYGVTFTGGLVRAEELIGNPGDFYRDPEFRGGAVRFVAVQAGAVLRLHAMFAEWLDENRRGEDPYQVARLGRVAIAAQEAAMWVEKTASMLEETSSAPDHFSTERLVDCANMARTAMERIATSVMQEVIVGVGARGLLQPARFERVIRDLTMYLRQPAPDQVLASVGRTSLARAHRHGRDRMDEYWSDTPSEESLRPSYFRQIYARKGDPWSFATSEYERGKYETTIAALPREKYKSGLEVGCSIGVLTRLLAAHCASMLALDVSERALEQARERCQDLEHVQIQRIRVPQEMPEGLFDLIVISEVAYYWTPGDLGKAADRLADRQLPGGHLVLVHLTEKVPDYPQTGDEVHDYWLSRPEWKQVSGERRERYRIDILERLPDATLLNRNAEDLNAD